MGNYLYVNINIIYKQIFKLWVAIAAQEDRNLHKHKKMDKFQQNGNPAISKKKITQLDGASNFHYTDFMFNIIQNKLKVQDKI